jgi:Siphovirus Gp157
MATTEIVPLKSLSGQLFEDFFQSIVDQVDQEGFDDAQRAELAKYLEGAIEKRDRLGEFIVRLEAEAEAIRNEEKRLATRRQGFEKIAGHVRSSIHQQMLDWQVKKVEGKLFTFAVQKNPASVEITNEADIPGDYIDYKPQIDRNKVKQALQAGQEVPGAKLVTDRTSLRVR